MTAERMIGALFHPKPEQWGLRGDPYLWEEMSEKLAHTAIPESAEQLEALLRQAFETATDESMDSPLNSILIDRFAHGGMSSGRVCPEFWRESALPLLLQRAGTPS